MTFQHYSVLLNETIEQLDIKENGIYVDGTLGGGGHASAVLQRLGETGRLIGIDQDAAAIEAAGDRLAPFGDKVTIVRSNYSAMPQVLADLGIHGVDGIVLDLGVSSYQLDTVERGFTYREDTVLDMRMDQRQTKTARDIVNDYTETELFHMIRDYGEDKFAKNIAKHIVAARQKAPIETTGQLTEIIRASIPMKFQKKSGHPAKRTFQAIRIEVNDELNVFERALTDSLDLLNVGGRVAVISFHSLEDKITKYMFNEKTAVPDLPMGMPVIPEEYQPRFKKVTRKPIVADEKELSENRRSHSAKLRVIERIRDE